jgi:riboflavin synthase
MFTGIVEEIGSVAAVATDRLTVGCAKVLGDAAFGSSIMVNGVCLTVVELGADRFAADVSPETLSRSNLGELHAGSRVNLERPLQAGGRLNGHIVQGHIDGTGEFLGIENVGGGNWWLRVRVPAELDRYLAFKGSIAIDGISLTVASVESGVVGVAVIPTTFRETTLGAYRAGARVNVECDILAKHVERLLGRLDLKQPLTVDKLREQGF